MPILTRSPTGGEGSGAHFAAPARNPIDEQALAAPQFVAFLIDELHRAARVRYRAKAVAETAFERGDDLAYREARPSMRVADERGRLAADVYGAIAPRSGVAE